MGRGKSGFELWEFSLYQNNMKGLGVVCCHGHVLSAKLVELRNGTRPNICHNNNQREVINVSFLGCDGCRVANNSLLTRLSKRL